MTFSIFSSNIKCTTSSIDNVFSSKITLDLPSECSDCVSVSSENMSFSQSAIVLVEIAGASTLFIRSHSINENRDYVLALDHLFVRDAEYMRRTITRRV
jgi:hypothetical protein